MTLAQRRTQAEYYKRLAREGHSVDDLHRLPNGTFLDTGIQRPTATVSLEAMHAHEVEATVWDTPEAAYWRKVSAAAQDLPSNYPRRRFLVAWSNCGDVLNAARSCGLSRKAGRYAVRRFLARMERTN